jgi:hypothetical protein
VTRLRVKQARDGKTHDSLTGPPCLARGSWVIRSRVKHARDRKTHDSLMGPLCLAKGSWVTRSRVKQARDGKTHDSLAGPPASRRDPAILAHASGMHARCSCMICERVQVVRDG